MSFATQLLVWSLLAGGLVGFLLEPMWRSERVGLARLGPVVAAGLFTVVWASRLDFFKVVHLAYLLATAAPVGLLLVAVVTDSGRRRLRATAGRLAAAALLVPPLVGLYASHVEPYWLRVDRTAVVNDAGDGLRIGVLADLQSPDIGDYERDAVATLIDEDLDLVVVPGDLWQADDAFIAAEWGRWAGLFAELVEAVGTVVMIEGNTDHIGWIELIAAQSGAVVVHDRVAAFEIDGHRVVIGGTRDTADRPAPATLQAMQELVAMERDASDEVVTIALSHRPDIVEWLDGDVDLIVSGHTHGGQIQVPFVGPLITASSVPREVAAGGLHEVDGHRIYVSTGVGFERSGPQIRFGVRPSVGVLELVAAEEQ